MKSDHYKSCLVVVGGGAAGFFCAVNAARMNPSLRVIVLEKSGKLLSKVKVSGGGRCNATHACFDIAEMMKHYPRGSHFVKKLFHRFFTTDTIAWFKERGVALKTEPDGRMFPVSNSSQTIIDCLLSEATKYGVETRMHTEVKSITPTAERFILKTAFEDIGADFVCIAAGGFPKSSQYEWLSAIGHRIVSPVPSLFTFNLPGHPITKLMGVSIDNVLVKISGTKLQQEGPLLITHWGLSGPCILRLSALAARELAASNWHFKTAINWVHPFTDFTLREHLVALRFQMGAHKMAHKNPFGLPQRLWVFLLGESGIGEAVRWADLSAKAQNVLIQNLVGYPCSINGKTTFKEEFVTAGGLSLQDIDPQTMMSKKLPRLFFAGEVIDVDGVTGGFNFQNAWSTGYVAAEGISRELAEND